MTRFPATTGLRALALVSFTLAAPLMIDAHAQEPASERASERIVTVSASGSVAAVPDVAHITTGVATEGATAREALDANTKAMRAVIDGLKSAGIDPKDIRTTHIGVDPRHQTYKDGRPPSIAGYRVTNQVRITVRDVAKLGDTLDRSITLGANQLGGIAFEVSGADKLKDDARRRAVENARARAELYATAAGAALGRVLTIAETAVPPPGPRVFGGARMAMAEAVPIEAGQQSLEVTVHVTWALK